MSADVAAAERSRAEIARRNGVLSRGPATPEGRARSARNNTRHGLCAKTPVPVDGDEGAAALAALRGALLARHLPRDAAEAHWVEELAFTAWRQRRLRTLESEFLARAGTAGEEAGTARALPSLSTLIRYRARLDRDWRRAGEELELLRRDRAVPPSPAQLRAVADLIERGQAAVDGAAEEKRTNENRLGTDEPDAPPARRALNRHQRRRLAALARRGLRRAA